MSGLDTSQELTVDASKNAEEHHEHSRRHAADTEGGAPAVEGDEPTDGKPES